MCTVCVFAHTAHYACKRRRARLHGCLLTRQRLALCQCVIAALAPLFLHQPTSSFGESAPSSVVLYPSPQPLSLDLSVHPCCLKLCTDDASAVCPQCTGWWHAVLVMTPPAIRERLGRVFARAQQWLASTPCDGRRPVSRNARSIDARRSTACCSTHVCATIVSSLQLLHHHHHHHH